jgi:hypothetical protein
MDKYITIRQNKAVHPSAVVGRTAEVRKLFQSIENRETVFLHGPSGVGKTYLVQRLLEHEKCIYVDLDSFKSRQALSDFFASIRSSDAHIVIDDFDAKAVDLLTGVGSRGATIVVSRDPVSANSVAVTPLSVDTLVSLGVSKFTNCDPDKIRAAAERSRGNIRNFFDYVEDSGYKDTFVEPKALISDLLCKDVSGLGDLIGNSIDEHGYTWGIVHDNYPDATAIGLPELEEIADCMSMADVVDTKMFNGDWEHSKLFSLYAVLKPVSLIQCSLDAYRLRPGSSWTKYNNFKMRQSRVCDIRNRTGLDTESLTTLKEYCIHDKDTALNLLKSYKIQSSDVDIMNHLALVNKMKTRTVTQLKKFLSASSENG